MSKHLQVRAFALAVGMAISTASFADTLSASQYQTSKDRIAADYKAAQAACERLAGNANEICEEQAKGNRSVGVAELEYRVSGSEADRAEVATTKSQAAHSVAVQKCADQAGNPKDVCVKEADAAQMKADADTKMAQAGADVRHQAAEETREADYQVAVEKCDALTGNAKTACISHAQALDSSKNGTTKDRIVADEQAANAACDRLAGNPKDICQLQAKGDKNVALAELEYRRSGTDSDRANIAMARSEAVYEVAKERCDDKAGNAKDVCVQEAQAMHVKANADAKLNLSRATARAEASGKKRDADYKVAIEKCDALAGDAQAACVTESKVRFATN